MKVLSFCSVTSGIDMDKSLVEMKFLMYSLLLCMSVNAELSKNKLNCSNIVSRNTWGARIPFEVHYSIRPVEYAIIHHTVTEECNTEFECSGILLNIQNFHMEEMNFHDIGYNFVIGGDGNVYEGAGFHKIGAHTYGYNSRSIGIAFIGDFSRKLPNKNQITAAQKFLECAVALGELDTRYKLIGGRQTIATESPGLKLFQEIQNWDHFARKL